MAHSDPSQTESSQSLEDLLAEAKATARDQLQAASQLQIDRLQQQIEAAWQGDLERILQERIDDAAARIDSWHQNEAGSKLAEVAANARSNARRDLAEQMERAVRRLRQFESEEQWSQALLEGTRGFCERAALFLVNGQTLELRAARGIAEQKQENIPLGAAPAFAAAVESGDTVIAMRTRSELSEAVAALVGESSGSRSSLFPLTARDRVPAILYADSPQDQLEPAAIEMLCSVASAVLESVVPNRRSESSQLVSIAQPGSESARPSWYALNREEQSLHLRAQRFARVHVAEMQLYRAQSVKAGRGERNLYAHLRESIDTGRAGFRNQFLSQSGSMVDYFHLELLRTLANDDAALLGSEYPGAMV